MPRNIIVIILLTPFIGLCQINDFIYQTYRAQKQFIFSNSQCNNQLSKCDFNLNISNIAYHPSGNIIARENISIFDKNIGSYIDSINFLELDFKLCSAKYLFHIKLNKFSHLSGLFYIDYLGRYYIEDLIQNTVYRTKINDTIFAPVTSFNKKINVSDMMLIKDNIIFMDSDSNYIYKCDTNWNIISQQNFIGNRISSFTNNIYSCDSTEVIISTTNSTPEENQKNIYRSGVHFYSYDIDNNQIINNLCFYYPPDSIFYAVGLSSFSEFLSADPECDLLIDLDRNNSSGLFPYDYQASAALCLTADETPLCDQDLYLHTSFPLDSVSICITGGLNGVDEFIYSTGLPAGFILNKNTDSCWTLFKKNGSDLEYADALKSLRYRNISANRISGLRIIQLQGINTLKKGSLIRAFIQVGKRVIAGQDTSLILCNDKSAIQLNTLLSNTSDKNGQWIPSLNSNSDLFKPGIDNYGTYQYIVSDIYCGSDTARVDIMNGTVIPFDLGPDQSICNGERVKFFVRPPPPNEPYDDILWNGNNYGQYHELNQPGIYILAIKSIFGCWAYDTILISKSTQVIPLDSTISICENQSYIYKNKTYHPLDIIHDTITAINGCDTLLSLRLIPLANIPKNQVLNLCPGDTFFYKNMVYLSGDIIHDTLSGINTCDTILNLQLIPYQISKVNIIADTLICKNKTTLITASPTNKYLWSTGETVPIITKGPGTYQLTVTDYNLCTTVSSITIKEAPPIEYLVEPYDPQCSDDRGRIIMQRVQGGIPPVRYLLNSIENKSGIFDNLNPGQYIATFIDAIGCEIKDTIIILPAAAFDVSVTNLIEIDKGASVLVSYIANQGQIQNIRFDPNQDISKEGNALRIVGSQDRDYTITFIDSNGCEVIHQLQIRIIDHEEFFTPNLFSPNQDNVNDTWKPIIGTSLEVIQIAVYDRWGESVFSTSDRNTGWNGICHNKPCVPGVYVYMIQVKDKTGKTKTYSGDLTLVR